MNESCHTYEWVMSHLWMSHVTHMNESCHTYEWVMSHLWMSHVKLMKESWYPYEWVLSHVWMSHVTHMNESCHTYEWVMIHMNGSCHTYEWVTSHIWMTHVTYMNESCHTYERVTIHIWMSPVARMPQKSPNSAVSRLYIVNLVALCVPLALNKCYSPLTGALQKSDFWSIVIAHGNFSSVMRCIGP